MTEVIINGGDPLKGCPGSWDDAYEWIGAANEGKSERHEPTWEFDCGFKLDFDGPLVSVESRFYPPKTHYGPKWDGSCTIRRLGKEISEKRFEADTLDELKALIETYISGLKIKVT